MARERMTARSRPAEDVQPDDGVFDPSRNPEDYGGTPQGETPGEQAGDPKPEAER